MAALLCFAPFLASLRSLGDPFGQTEEGVNAAIWALGGRNIQELGWRKARFGAVVRPFSPATGYIYAHHPPLPVWISRAWTAVGTGEALPRTVALLGLAVALWFLFRSLRLYVSEQTALVALSASAMTVYATRYGRLLTTLTLATPLFCAALFLVLRQRRDRASPHPALSLLIPALVFSSWDGVLGAAVVCTAVLWEEIRRARESGVSSWPRTLLVCGLGVASFCLLLLYLQRANGTLSVVLEQARYRSGAGRVSWVWFVRTQSWYLRQGLGLINLTVCAVMLGIFLVRRNLPPLGRAALLGAVPAVAMTVLMRDGAAAHWFWAYNLIIPLAFLVASALEVLGGATAAGGLLLLLILGQDLSNYAKGAMLLGEERRLNAAGAFFRSILPTFPEGTVRVFAGYDFHPYLAWYGRRSDDAALSVRELRAKVDSGHWSRVDEVLVDNFAVEVFGCGAVEAEARSSTGRWLKTSVGALLDACARASR